MAASPKICKHVHLPLQTASDGVLERMRRGYTTANFRRW
jgi:tRNA A37 methylthiotransferase MiaB